jgi:hypothetical protein
MPITNFDDLSLLFLRLDRPRTVIEVVKLADHQSLGFSLVQRRGEVYSPRLKLHTTRWFLDGQVELKTTGRPEGWRLTESSDFFCQYYIIEYVGIGIVCALMQADERRRGIQQVRLPSTSRYSPLVEPAN